MKMDKRINAAFVTMLFLLGIIAVPVSAHFTMGNHLPAYPFRSRHFDPHQMGPVGYVFPGGGLFTNGAPGWYWGTGQYPGYQSPWPYWTSGVNNPFPAQGPMGWYQLDANNYAPFGAILTSTIKAGTKPVSMWEAFRKGVTTAPGGVSDNPTIESLEVEHQVRGDLLLAFNVTASWKKEMHDRVAAWAGGPINAVNFTRIEFWIPPEFSTNIARQNIVPSWTNNYDLITISTRNREDPTGPFWRRVRIQTDTAPFSQADQRTFDKADDAPDSWLDQGISGSKGPFKFSPWKTFGNITFSLLHTGTDPLYFPDEWYYIRINDVVAPTIAGAYFFKFTALSNNDRSLTATGKPWAGMSTFPTANYPVVLVKGEVDPAVITGTIRYGGWNTSLYGTPIDAPGRVRAVGVADDPYTGKSTGRPVEARGYFDLKWKGHYEIEGVAPGVYDIYASAAGYPEMKIASNVKILKGQSYHIDGYLVPGVQIRGTVFSKCGTGEVPFPLLGFDRDIKIEIYRTLADAQSMLPGGSTSKAATWSPIGNGATLWSNTFTKGPYGEYGWAFPWGAWANSPGQTSPTITSPLEPTANRFTANPRGVGPAQNWYVTSGGTSFTFQFGREGLYGAPCDLVGHIPGFDEVVFDGVKTTVIPWYNATWASGIGPGTYVTRAWLYRYVQTEIDGVTFMPVTFTVPSIEWPGNVYIPFDLRISSLVKKEVHFHDVPGTLMESPIGWGWSDENTKYWTTARDPAAPGVLAGNFYRFLVAELAATGTTNYKNPVGEALYAYNMIPVNVIFGSAFIEIAGFHEFGLTYGWGRNYGVNSGLYTVKAYMWGYVEQVFEKVNLGLCNTVTLISDHLYRGAKFNLTVYSKDWEHPTMDRFWSFPYQPIYVQIWKDGTLVMPGYQAQFVMPITMQGYGNTTVAMWPYMWNNPYFMIRSHDSVAQVFGLTGYASPWGPDSRTYLPHYFGPSAGFGEAGGVHFRYYDGSENYLFMWSNGYFSDAGIGECVGYYPYSFESGTYEFRGLTYGYVQKKPVVFYATKGGIADILIKLTQGAELQLNIKFKHEGVFETIPFDAHLRVRVLDDKNNLVGEYITSDWWWQPQFEAGQPTSPTTTTANYTRYAWNLRQRWPTPPLGINDANFAWGHPFSGYTPGSATGSTNGHRNLWRLNYVPAGTDMVKVVIAGLPDLYGWAYGSPCDPCLATGPMGYDKPVPDAAPYGIDGYPNYKGAWKIQVHVVPIPTQPPWYQYSSFSNYIGYYGPGQYGFLMGELTYTADMKPVYINHLGPYELRYDVVVPGTHLGGESSLVFELDRRGLITGTVYGYTYCDDWRTAAWTTVLFTAADGTVFTHYTFDGWFGAWLNAGPYTASVVFWTPTKGEGYKVQTMPYHVSDGAMGTFNIYLEQSGVPIPEFPVSTIVLAFGLAASLAILRRRRRK